jgi:hypothetical protein
MGLLLMIAFEACGLADCPAGLAHPQSVEHTQGKTCACGRGTDRRFALCADCAGTRGLCAGCGAKPLKATASATSSGATRLVDGRDVEIDRGEVMESEKASLGVVREFEDRIEINLAVTGALCGNEPRVRDGLRVRLPERTSKKVVVREIRSSPAGPSRPRLVATLLPR